VGGSRPVHGPGDCLRDVPKLPSRLYLGVLAIFRQFLHPTMPPFQNLDGSSTPGICENLLRGGGGGAIRQGVVSPGRKGGGVPC
jgi:hypothetical protein